MLVVISHAGKWLPDLSPLSLGNVGVFSFFVLSGFVIAEALDVFYVNSPVRFALNRALKIYPGYWAAALLAVAVALFLGQPLRMDAISLAANLTILFSYLPVANNTLYVSVAWAVVVELFFYAIFAALFFADQRLRAHGRLLFATAIFLLSAAVSIDYFEAYFRWFSTLRFAPFFILGVAFYFATTRQGTAARALVVAALPLSLSSYGHYVHVAAGAWWSVGLLVASMAAFAGLGLMRSMSRRTAEIDRVLGDFTYTVYLSHMSVMALVGATALSDGAKFSAGILASIPVGIALHLAVERPFARIRDMIRGLRVRSAG